MRIVVDMQGAQANDFTHGIGPYALAFAKALVRSREAHDIFLVLSDLRPHSIRTIRSEFYGLLPQENIRLFVTPPRGTIDNTLYKQISELAYSSFIASLKPDAVHCTDLETSRINALKNINSPGGRLPVTVFNWANGCVISTQQINTHAYHLNLEVINSNDIDQTSAAAFDTWKNLTENYPLTPNNKPIKKPRLAHVSPLPPERSGIADYSADLLPALSKYYEIDVVTNQADITCPWIKDNCQTLTVEEFLTAAPHYDRILYHFGNNPMHTPYFEALQRHPGIVVLHDFFLSGAQKHRDAINQSTNGFWKELYASHGYNSIRKRFIEGDEATTLRYPCNFDVIKNSFGTIVHSKHSVKLAKNWYYNTDNISVIPLLKVKPDNISKKQARKALGIAENKFLVCSFGFLGKTKQNHRLLEAWESSEDFKNAINCELVFVGYAHKNTYNDELKIKIAQHTQAGSIRITGWTDPKTYQLYLAAADLAVQLRTSSRGETSAAVLDCMGQGIATIVNANGSMADLPGTGVCKLPDDFSSAELVTELEKLYIDTNYRNNIALAAKSFVQSEHAPTICADKYHFTIEKHYLNNHLGLKPITQNLGSILPSLTDDDYLLQLADALSYNLPDKKPAKCLYIDVSAILQNDLKTGIQRVVRALTIALLDCPPEGYRIEPVYLSDVNGKWLYRHARNYTFGLIGADENLLEDEIIDAQAGDTFLGLDFACGHVINADNQGLYHQLQNLGINVTFVVYDLLPILLEPMFPPGVKEIHTEWLKVIAKADTAICISSTVANELHDWVVNNVTDNRERPDISWFHLGSDIDTSCPTMGLPNTADKVLEQINRIPSFIMVGTVEPRKGHEQVLKAFDILWSQEVDINLVIVGKEGWMIDSLATRLRNHPEQGKRLFWLESISDEYLLKTYEASTCLLAASLGEGFGLPLIEAAQHNKPIIARNIPVFKEVAKDHAFYFSGSEPQALSEAVQRWLRLYQNGEHPASTKLPWLTWRESAQSLSQILKRHQKTVR
ncbi:glycosyltransferase [Gilvimarinus sp. 1_MG-2023]|uniref:glycosyltransferase n=1 Tax=Gilvimarinus sp. 1_MG-2023 TaxID=3062638 RepID=UPI0026E34811|nr:glycosyltransferase [Gilvimarinus sp. 1_MG-2023]MDO6746303.1 glycosyltransferase [Gilvimarinus sp. 1_MG-2023]